jgi:hypothetical protein
VIALLHDIGEAITPNAHGEAILTAPLGWPDPSLGQVAAAILGPYISESSRLLAPSP